MTTRDAALRSVDELIRQLSVPLPAEEVEAGWTPENQQAFLDLFKQLREAIALSKPLPDLNYIYGMDVSGIDEGEIMNKTATMMRTLDLLRSGCDV